MSQVTPSRRYGWLILSRIVIVIFSLLMLLISVAMPYGSYLFCLLPYYPVLVLAQKTASLSPIPNMWFGDLYPLILCALYYMTVTFIYFLLSTRSKLPLILPIWFIITAYFSYLTISAILASLGNILMAMI